MQKYKLKCTSWDKLFTRKDYYQNHVNKCNSGEKTVELSKIQNYFDNEDKDKDFVPSMFNISNSVAVGKNIERIEADDSLNSYLARYKKQIQF